MAKSLLTSIGIGPGLETFVVLFTDGACVAGYMSGRLNHPLLSVLCDSHI